MASGEGQGATCHSPCHECARLSAFNGIWVNNRDLSKVDEVGFADLMPGSGHGTGGYIHLCPIEVFGKAVPRTTTTASNR